MNDPRTEAAAGLLAREYGVTGRLSRLAGENLNYLVEVGDGRRFVLKIATAGGAADALPLEEAATRHLVGRGLELYVPAFVPTNSGAPIASLDPPEWESRVLARLVTFVPGTPLGELATLPPGLLEDLGRRLAELDRAFASFAHPAMHRTHQWDPTAAGQHRARIPLVREPARRRLLEEAFHLWAACAAPRLASLPRSFIHCDANDENVLVEDGRVRGILDFGDALHAPTICELAITIAYAMLDREDPLATGAEVVAGYHAVRPLRGDELAVLYPLVVGRLATSLVIAAGRRQEDPDRASWFTTEARAWALLESLAPIAPADATAQLASHTDLEPDGDRGAPAEELLERRRREIGPSLSIAYSRPLKIVRGSGQYLHERSGRPYLDLVNNVCHVGHCHPTVVAAGQRQMERLNTNSRYLYDGLTEYAERLTAHLPEPLRVCYLVNSGSEANELALRLVRTHTGRKDMLVVDGAYHGHTTTLIDLSPYKFMGAGGAGRPEDWVHVVPLADGYRGIHRGHGRDAGIAYGDEVGRVIAECGRPVGGFLVESLLSCGGQVIPPDGYLETAFAHVHAAGGLCVADEVQVGFGRVGTHFWAFETQGVVPDIVVMGKPIGNGHPLAAVVTTPDIARSFANGMEFFSTFGGNPVSCAIGIAVLDVIEREGLQEHARTLGAHMLAGLRALAERHPIIGDARGLGLFLGLELVRDRDTLAPADTEARALVERMKERGVLLSTDGPHRNVLKIKPPMVLDRSDVDMVLRCLDDELGAL